jgi:hypothetical protein
VTQSTRISVVVCYWTAVDVAVGKITSTVNNKADAATLHNKPNLAAESQLVDDGTGERTVWRVEQSQLASVPETLHGVFFSSDSYVVKYKYSDGHSEKYLIYSWLVSCLIFLGLEVSHVLKQKYIENMMNSRVTKDLAKIFMSPYSFNTTSCTDVSIIITKSNHALQL